MPQQNSLSFERMLSLARNGDKAEVSQLLETYRHYLRLLARMQLSRGLQARVSPSDLVQESILAAHAAFNGFRGATEHELTSWLRKVLSSRLVDVLRFHSAKRRDVNAQQSLQDHVDQSSLYLNSFVADYEASPSEILTQREEALLLSEALQRLPAEHSEVITLHHLEGKTFAEIAESMRKTVPSVKGIWARGMTKLRRELRGSIDESS